MTTYILNIKNQISIFTFYLIIFISFINNNLYSQSINDSRQSSYYTYVYKLSENEADNIYKKNKISLDIIENKLPIDSFPTENTDYPKYENGNYLFVLIRHKNIHISIETYSSLRTNLISNQRDLCIEVRDEKRELLKDAIVTLNDKQIKYDANFNAYLIPNTNKKGLIKIKKGNDVIYYVIDNKKYKRKIINNIIYYSFIPVKLLYNFIIHPRQAFKYYVLGNHRNHKHIYNGYIAMNKPRYLPNDTVKIKGYILKNDKKPLNKKLLLDIKDSKSNNVLSAGINPIKKGNYIFEFLLGDSLKIDQEYRIALKKKNGETLATNHFYLEDYQLKEVFYSFWIEKETYYYEDSIRFYAMASDINELPIYDAKVKISAEVISVKDYQNQITNIPLLLWEKEIHLNPNDITQITLPDSLIPNASLKIKLTATFNNSNNETQIYSSIFDIKNKKDEIDVKEQNNNYLLESNLIDNQIAIVSEYRDGIQTIVNTTLPSKFKINPLVSKYIIRTGNKEKIILLDTVPNMVNVDFVRNNDSIVLNIENPRKLGVKYVIYKNNNEIIRGETTENLFWENFDKSSSTYYVNYNFTWAGNNYKKSKYSRIYKNELKVDIIQPEIVFPGQKNETKIKVLDYQNKPVPNSDITAFATNAQFKKNNIPNIDYLGKQNKSLKSKNNYSINESAVTGSYRLNKEWLNKTNSDTLLFYKFNYPEKNGFFHYDTTYVKYSQFAPFIFYNGIQQPIYYIYADSTLIYFNETFNDRPFSFPLDEGFHSLRIRTNKYEYFLDSIYIKKNKKLSLSFDKKENPFLKKKKSSQSLTTDEFVQLGKCFFIITKLPGSFKFWQGINSQTVKTSYQTNINLGPFDLSQPIKYQNLNRYGEFLFKPNTFYTYLNDENSFLETKKTMISRLRLHRYSTQKNDDLFTDEPIVLKKTSDIVTIEEKYPSSTFEGNGTYLFNFNCDSTIREYKFFSYSNLLSTQQVIGGNIRIVYNLTPDLYKIEFITQNGNILLKDSIQILPNTYTCENISCEDIEMLNKVTFIKEHLNYYNTVSGKIINENDGTPIPYAFIRINNNSKNIDIETFSDNEGRFLIQNIPTGRYNINIESNGFITENTYFNVSEIKKDIEYPLKKVFSQFSFLDNSSFQKPELKHYYHRNYNRKINNIKFMKRRKKRYALYDLKSTRGSSLGSTSSYSNGKGENYINSNETNSNIDSDKFIFTKPDINKMPLIESDSSKLNIRSNFVDYAYWKPLLSTNSEGETSFSFKYPDNITKWLNYALVINDNKQSGIGFSTTKSLSQIAATLSIPRFLTKSDSTNVIGKSLNYTNDILNIKTGLMLNDSLVYSKDTSIQNICIESFPVNNTSGDSLSLSYYLQLDNGFSDGEKRTIPIYPVGIYENTGKFYILDNDSTIEAKFNPDSGRVKIIANNSEIEVFLNDAKWLYNYKYSCLEQKASKLIGLLSEKFISEILNKRFNKENEIFKLIRKIEKEQIPSGAFGWWKDMDPNIWVTNYVVNTLNYAQINGYTTPALKKGVNFLIEWLDEISLKESRYSILNTLYLLSEIGVEVDYEGYINKIDTNDIPMLEKFKIVGIRQNAGLQYDVNEILNTKQETMLGGTFWDEDYYENSIYYNNTQLTLLAYKILDKERQYDGILKSISHYFFEKRMNQSFSNTIETAQILETILPAYIKNTKEKLVSTKLRVNENVIQKFPYETYIDTNFVKISKEGTSPLFITIMQEQWNENPIKNETYFKINTYFEQDGKIITELKSGQPVKLIAEITPLKEADYIMIEIPIPAGCFYGQKQESRYRIHSEYFKNTANFYCESMKPQTYKFEIELQPRFTGKYVINPAKVELMYFPTFYSNEIVKSIIIK